MVSGHADLGLGPVMTAENGGSPGSRPFDSQALSKTVLFSETAVSATPSFLDLFFLSLVYVL